MWTLGAITASSSDQALFNGVDDERPAKHDDEGEGEGEGEGGGGGGGGGTNSEKLEGDERAGSHIESASSLYSPLSSPSPLLAAAIGRSASTQFAATARTDSIRSIRNSAMEMKLFNAPELDEAVGAKVYALLMSDSSETLLPLKRSQPQLLGPAAAARPHHQTKSIEIVIEMGDDVHIIEQPAELQHVPEPSENAVSNIMPSSAPKPIILHLEPNFSEDGQPLVLRASDLLISAGRDQDTLLHLVAFHGNTAALEDLFRAFFRQPHSTQHVVPNIDLKNKDCRTPLHYASGKGQVDVVRMLLDQGADKKARDINGVLPFHFAARCRNTTLLEMLQVGPNQVDVVAMETGMTALHYAAWNGRSEAVEWLLSQGASVDLPDTVEGNTSLHWAASREKCFRVIESLIAGGGADAQIQNKKGYWPIGLADKGGHHELAKAIVRAIRRSTAIRMGVRKSMKTALLTDRQNSDGATMFHFFAAYGTQEDLEWFLALLQERIHNNRLQEKVLLNPRDQNGRSVVHWAARLANKGALRVFAENGVDMNNGIGLFYPHKTPLSQAVIEGDMEFADELLKWKPTTEDWLSGTYRWLEDYYSQRRVGDSKFEMDFVALQDGFERYSRQHMKGVLTKKSLFLEMSPIYLALHADREDIAIFIRRYCTGVEDAVNARGGAMRWTALHWATFLEKRRILSTLCRSEHFAPFLTANVEDILGRTALQYAKHMKLSDIENELMQRSDVKAYVDSMYNDRQLYVDAANAILVGAALIASVTFVGWLQPPLSYTPYYNLPQLSSPSPPNTYQSYAAMQQNVGVRCFWVFNSLSFTMAICTMLAGLVGVAPIPGVFIANAVKHLQRCLVLASAFLGISIVFVFAAFAAAGFAVLPPLFEYQANMMATIIVGGVPCIVLLASFAARLWAFRSKWIRDLLARVRTTTVEFQPSTSSVEAPFSSTRGTNIIDVPTMSKDYSVGPRYRNRPWDDGLDPPMTEADRLIKAYQYRHSS